MTRTPVVRADSPLATLLIVDDTIENLRVLDGVLRPHYRVRAATSGARAIQAATTEPRPDLILLDIMMPEMDGYTVMDRLRSMPEIADIPVIFVSALDDEADEETGLTLGAVDYITKPVRPAIVLARVRAHLELKHARDALRDQNAFLEAEVARRMRDNQVVQDVSIRALANLAETRDTDTGNHIRRTQAYVEALATRLMESPLYEQRLTIGFVSLMTKAAPLHDLGKVGIPDHILLKPGRLTPEEFEEMKSHTTIGDRAIERAMTEAAAGNPSAPADARREGDDSPLAFLAVARQIARSHHERWDGGGYPDGLAGDAIPLAARVMALADVFDALISRRVYKRPIPFEEAVRIIASGGGKQFDPDVVAAFDASLDEFRTIAERYEDPAPPEG